MGGILSLIATLVAGYLLKPRYYLEELKDIEDYDPYGMPQDIKEGSYETCTTRKKKVLFDRWRRHKRVAHLEIVTEHARYPAPGYEQIVIGDEVYPLSNEEDEPRDVYDYTDEELIRFMTSKKVRKQNNGKPWPNKENSKS